MSDLRWHELVEWAEAEPVGSPKPRRDRKVKICTDTRAIAKGDVFWVLKGDRFDGHDFVEQAFEKGGAAAVVEKKWLTDGPFDKAQDKFCPTKVYVPVEDVGHAFLKVASRHAARHRIPRVVVAGSNGKTTTKEMVARVLGAKGPVLKTEGNFNNHVGVPMTLLRIGSEHKSAVIELGTSSPGELAPLSKAAAPSIAVLTNIGHEHMEFFKTLEAVRDEELTVTAGLRTGGTLVMNADDPYLQKVRTNARFSVLGFGLRRGQVRPAQLEFDEQGCGSFLIGRTRFSVPVPGVHNVYNALAAISVGLDLGIPKGQIKDAIESFRAVDGRMNVLEANGIKVIDDCYNANPPSVRSALQILSSMAVKGRRVAVLGDMLELGEASREMHQGIGRLVAELELDQLWCLGARAKDIAASAKAAGMGKAKIRHFLDKSELEAQLLDTLAEGDTVLVKASHGLRLDTLVKRLVSAQTVIHPGEPA
jgi:UDP-N-acetylmuramoyl-tripeptide--D-alanyl-D-alanine ligase